MKILVIDDQEWRKKFYKKLETVLAYNMRVYFIEEERVHSINDIFLREFDLILLDVVLDGDWRLRCCDAARVIREANKIIPIALMTGNWSATNYSEIQEITSNYDTESVPLPFTDLLSETEYSNLTNDQIDKRDSKGVTRNNLPYLARTLNIIYHTRHKQKSLNKKNDEPLTLLHLSDMQLGGEHEQSSLLDPASIAQKVKSNHGVPDFICISGDIAENGYKSEFDKASEWISDLCRELGWEPPFDRLFLTPGNHDVLSSTFGMCKYEYKRGEREARGKLTHQEQGIIPINGISKLSINHFNQFAFNLTNRIDWLRGDNSYWVDSRFISCGVNFIGLNTLATNSFSSPFKGLPNDHTYKELRTLLGESKLEENILNIAIFHHPDLKDDPCFQAFSEVKPAPALLLAGHEHKSKFEQIRDQQQLMTVAPTSSLKAELRWADANRGFSVIRFERNNGVVKKLKQISYIRVNQRWTEDGLQHEFEYKPCSKSVWREVYSD